MTRRNQRGACAVPKLAAAAFSFSWHWKLIALAGQKVANARSNYHIA